MCKDLFIYYNERSLKTVSLDTFIRSHWSFFVNFYTLKTKKCNNSHITFGVGQLCYLIWHHRSNPVSKTRFPCLFVFLLVSLSCSLSFVYLLATARFAALFWSASLDVWWFLLLRRSVIHQNTTLKSVHGCFRCLFSQNFHESVREICRGVCWICGESVGNLWAICRNLSGICLGPKYVPKDVAQEKYKGAAAETCFRVLASLCLLWLAGMIQKHLRWPEIRRALWNTACRHLSWPPVRRWTAAARSRKQRLRKRNGLYRQLEGDFGFTRLRLL